MTFKFNKIRVWENWMFSGYYKIILAIILSWNVIFVALLLRSLYFGNLFCRLNSSTPKLKSPSEMIDFCSFVVIFFEHRKRNCRVCDATQKSGNIGVSFSRIIFPFLSHLKTSCVWNCLESCGSLVKQ